MSNFDVVFNFDAVSNLDVVSNVDLTPNFNLVLEFDVYDQNNEVYNQASAKNQNLASEEKF